MSDPIWVEEDIVLKILCIQTDSPHPLVRDQGSLESALARARHSYCYENPKPSIPSLAAEYAFGLCKNHPFVDGNKRVALAVSRTFLIRNGWDMICSQ